jgi:phosphoglycolate phosphatase-like HAD superfamily hydrolase
MNKSSSDLRIILWDIDGTLMRSHRPGEFTKYVAPTLERVFGSSGRLHELTPSGMTDLQIAQEALRDHGHTHISVRERLDELRETFMYEMERVTTAHAPFFYALPGARAALEAIERHPRYLSSLLTGNLHPAAFLKLRLVGLDNFFHLPGAFGDDSHDRRELPAIAHRRLELHLGHAVRPEQLIVIGDTPNDIACARHFRAHAIAVATGRSYTTEELRAHKPDAILPDLSDTNLLLQTLNAL